MISVIVIGRNEGERLSRCLSSVSTALGFLSHELIYVDSGSTDDSLARARRAGAACYRLLEAQPTAGLGRAVGAAHAKGEFLLFLDGDMSLLPGFCEQAIQILAQGRAEAVTGQRTDVYLQDGREAGREENYFHCTEARICPEFGGALFIAAKALRLAGGWSGDPIACEEAELHARLKASGARVLEIPIPMILHTDTVRESRGLFSAVFSRRRLGEGQALRAAFRRGAGRAYLRHARTKLIFWALDLSCLLALVFHGRWGLLWLAPLQGVQIGHFLAHRTPRAFVSQKLFFFALPIGFVRYRTRRMDAEEVKP